MKKEASLLYPYGSLDVLGYYSKIARVLGKFLAGREIATKTILKDFFFLKRGSNSEPLFVEDLRCVDDKILELRANHHLKQVKNQISEKQILVWKYFVPRKMINFFYACNGERVGRQIDRIFIDIDRQKHSGEDARKVALELVNTIKYDKDFNKILKFRMFLMWTGASFHVYLLLKRRVDLKFYNKYLSYGRKKPESFIMKWAEQVSEKLKKRKIKVLAGHEKQKNAIIFDSSNTPSGKLARAPFSLHVSGYNKFDGIALPLSEKELRDKNLVKKLQKITPEQVLKNISRYKKFLV